MKSNMAEVIQTILSDYRPEAQYLKSAAMGALGLIGHFQVDTSVHLKTPLEHITKTETGICVNQLERVLVAELVESGYVAEWGELDFVKWNPSKLGDEGLVIVHEDITFKAPINPGMEFEGRMWMAEERRSRNGNYHIKIGYSFFHDAHHGSLRICFIPSMAERVDIEELRWRN